MELHWGELFASYCEIFAQTYKWTGMKPNRCSAWSWKRFAQVHVRRHGSFLTVSYKMFISILTKSLVPRWQLCCIKNRHWMSSRTRSDPFMHSGMRKCWCTHTQLSHDRSHLLVYVCWKSGLLDGHFVTIFLVFLKCTPQCGICFCFSDIR